MSPKIYATASFTTDKTSVISLDVFYGYIWKSASPTKTNESRTDKCEILENIEL